MLDEEIKLTYEQMKELRGKCEEVSTEVFILLSENEKEHFYRKWLVEQFECYDNVSFFSNGGVQANINGSIYWLYAPQSSNPPPFE